MALGINVVSSESARQRNIPCAIRPDRRAGENAVCSPPSHVEAAPSMQLHVRFGAASNQSSKRVQGHLRRTVQRIFVQLVERTVHEASEQAFNPKVPAEKPSHQASDR
jgi:hypothetical protein